MKRLVKRKNGSVLDGVCAGIGEYLEVDPVLVRLAFVVAAFAGGAGIVAYIIAMIVMPDEKDLMTIEPRAAGASRDGAAGAGAAYTDMAANRPSQGAAAAGGPAQDGSPGREAEERAGDSRGTKAAGLVLAVVGVVLLLRNVGVLRYLMPWWPVALIVAGVMLYLRPGGPGREPFNSGGRRKC